MCAKINLMQKGFAHLLVIVLVAGIIAIGGVIYFTSVYPLRVATSEVKAIDRETELKVFQSTAPRESIAPKVSPTSPLSLAPKFNIYTSLNLGFQFEYPSDLIVQNDSEEDFSKRNLGDFRENFNYRAHYYPEKVLGGVSVNKSDSSSFFEEAPFSVWIFDNQNNLTADSWYKKYWFYPFIWGEYESKVSAEYSPKEEIIIGDQKAHFTVIDYQTGVPILILIPLDKKMFLFRLLSNAKVPYDQMINTFKFLK